MEPWNRDSAERNLWSLGTEIPLKLTQSLGTEIPLKETQSLGTEIPLVKIGVPGLSGLLGGLFLTSLGLQNSSSGIFGVFWGICFVCVRRFSASSVLF